MNNLRWIRTLGVTIGILFVLFDASVLAQQLTSEQAEEAKRQLGLMTPEEIDRKIKELGLTREEADKKAKDNGIDLQSYLRGASNSSKTGVTPTTNLLLESGPTVGMGSEPVVQSSDAGSSRPEKRFPTLNGLAYFGYDIFTTTPKAFEPSAIGPIDPEYIIGPDDVLRISIWGQVEQQNELTVDKEGRIFIPTAGPVVVSGLTIGEIEKTLTKQLSRSFQGLTAIPKTVWLDVTLAKVRPKRIFIMGEVEKPGGYTVNSYANVFNSLFAVGGPTVNGSLRDVRLIRENKIIAHIDLYLYLTGAEKNNDIRVQNNDIIFIPVRKNAISIKGEIRRPGIYELLPGENLRKLVEYAGGNLPSSYLERIQIARIVPLKERVKNELERKYTDVNYRDIILKNTDVAVVDGDVVTFFPILDEIKNFVTISGSVYKPGTYQLAPNMKLRDLIQLADSLRPEAYLPRAELTRLQNDNRTRISIPFDLKSVMEGDVVSNISLQSRDEILINSIDVRRVHQEFVQIFGSVKKPGQYLLTKNMTLIDVLMLAGGYKEDASILFAEVSRIDATKSNDTLMYLQYTHLPNLADSVAIRTFLDFEKARQNDILLRHRDHIFIRPNPNFHIHQIVDVTGEVMFPGQYALQTHNEYLSEIITRAGGTTSAGYLRGGILTRGERRVNVDFQQVANSPKTKEDIVLHPGDKIHVPKKPNTITMSGQINNPGLLGFIDGDDLWEYIDRAGGLTDSADYIFLFSPTGIVEKFSTGLFSGNATVLDGSTIHISKISIPPPEKEGESVGQLVRDLFAIAASALTILVLARQL